MQKLGSSQFSMVLKAVALIWATCLFLPQKINGETKAQAIDLTFAHFRIVHALIAPDAVKFYGMRWELIAKAPKWDACVYNRSTKKIYTIAHATWKKSGLNVLESALEPLKSEQKLPGTVNYLGLPCVHYRGSLLVTDGMYEDRQKAKKYVFDFYGTKAIAMTDEERQLFAYWFSVPLTADLPVLWMKTDETGQKTYNIKLVSYKAEPLVAETFNPPTNFKVARSASEVYLEQYKNTFADMFDYPLGKDGQK